MSHKVPGDDGGRWWSHEELSLLATPSYFDACFLDLDRVNSIYANRTRDLLSLSLLVGVVRLQDPGVLTASSFGRKLSKKIIHPS